jgi:hypothetical protein
MEDVLREMVVKITFAVNSAPMRQVDSHLSKLERRLDRIRRNSMQGMSSSFDSLARNSKRMAIGLTGATAGLGLFLHEAGSFNRTRIAFETMTGSVEKGRDLLKEVHDIALITPWGIQEVEQSASMLLGMGVAADNVVKTMLKLGNVASGVNRPLAMVAQNYGQVMTGGHMKGTELKDFIRQGVPIKEYLSKVMGVEKSSLEDLASNREISAEHVSKAFDMMTSKGERFDNLLVQQAKTWPAMMANFIIWLRMVAREIGQELLPQAKEYLQIVKDWIVQYKEVIKSNFVTAFKAVLKIIGSIGRTLRWALPWMKELVDLFGGFEKTLRLVLKLLAGMMLYNMAKLIGNMVISFGALVMQMGLLITGAATFNTIMGFLPFLIGVAVAGVALLIQDFKTFRRGGKSFIGDMAEEFAWFKTTIEGVIRLLDIIESKDKDFKKRRATQTAQDSWTVGDMGGVVYEGLRMLESQLSRPVRLQNGGLSVGAPTRNTDAGKGAIVHQNITIPISGTGDVAATAHAVKVALEGTVYKDLYTNSGGYAVSPTGN